MQRLSPQIKVHFDDLVSLLSCEVKGREPGHVLFGKFAHDRKHDSISSRLGADRMGTEKDQTLHASLLRKRRDAFSG